MYLEICWSLAKRKTTYPSCKKNTELSPVRLLRHILHTVEHESQMLILRRKEYYNPSSPVLVQEYALLSKWAAIQVAMAADKSIYMQESSPRDWPLLLPAGCNSYEHCARCRLSQSPTACQIRGIAERSAE